MSFDLTIPLSDGPPLKFTVAFGEIVFVLGANGTGKSSLLQRFYTAHQGKARRISAHRQNWFQSNVMILSAQQKKSTENSILHDDNDPQSRWMDNYAAHRANLTVYDLIDAENVRARAIAGAVDDENIKLARQLSKQDAPIKVINELLKLSNIPVVISVRESEQVMASRNGGPEYSIVELSDGERNALLIAANVLTSKPQTILFIDEPERHLHRSIISPLLSNLFARREDCAFVVSTHDVLLPLDNREARTLLVRGCTYQQSHVIHWDADILTNKTELDENLKRDILGNRRKLLFVEGTEESLDRPLYSLLFPHVSVIAKESCREVEHSVSSIRSAQNLHWLHAFGIVDNDRRTEANINELKKKGVYAVQLYSVESIYYHDEVMQRLASKQQTLTGANATQSLVQAKSAAIAAIQRHIQRLSERVVEASIRQDLMSKLPKRADIAQAKVLTVTIDVPAVVAAEVSRLTYACNAADLAAVIARYPVRETPALDRIATCLGFQGRSQYESAVRKLLMDDEVALSIIQSLFDTLKEDIDAT